MAQKISITKLIISLFIITILLCPYQIYAQNENTVSATTNNDTINVITHDENNNYGFAPGNIIVALKEGHENALDNLNNFSDIGVTSIKELNKAIKPQADKNDNSQAKNIIVLFKLNSTGKEDILTTIEKLKINPNVEYAEPDYYVHLDSTTPNDPYFYQLWGMNKIHAPLAWDTTTGNASVVVGIIDTGIDYNHQDLSSNMWHNPGEQPGNGIDDDENGYIDDYYGWDFVNDDCDPMDDYGHGTHCAGTIAAVGNNGIGVAGVNWTAQLAALKFISWSGIGLTSDAISAVNYANQMGIPITNNSYHLDGYSQAMKDTITAGGNLFIAAAGNNGANNDSNPTYPSCFDCNNILSVAATDSNDNLASFSNYGITSVDVAAPGVSIYSCYPTAYFPFSGYIPSSGTSMATPHVAGEAALFKSYYPDLSTNDLKDMILSRVDQLSQLSNIVASGGRLSFGGKITGQITLSGLSTGNATVIVKDPSDNVIATGLTDSNGAYTIPFVPAGTYTVTFEVPGNNVLITSGQTTTIP